MCNYIDLLCSGVFHHSLNELSDVDNVLQLVHMLGLVIVISPSPCRPVQLSLRVAPPEELFYGHPEPVIHPCVPDYAVPGPMHKHYRPTCNILPVILLATEGAPEDRGLIEAIGFIPGGVIQPGYEVGGQAAGVRWWGRLLRGDEIDRQREHKYDYH